MLCCLKGEAAQPTQHVTSTLDAESQHQGSLRSQITEGLESWSEKENATLQFGINIVEQRLLHGNLPSITSKQCPP
jgi:hypothetical protein